jgi:hypothetical protein
LSKVGPRSDVEAVDAGDLGPFARNSSRAIATFYQDKLNRLLKYPALANATLDAIDEPLIEKYVQERRRQVGPATVNRQLATLSPRPAPGP